MKWLIGHLTVTSLQNKLELLQEIIKDKIIIFLTEKTKEKKERNQTVEGILLLYACYNIPWKTTNEYTS